MGVPGDDDQPGVGVKLGGLLGVGQGHGLVGVPLNNEHGLGEAGDLVLHVEGLGHPDVVAVEAQAPGLHHVRNVGRVEGLAQEGALSGPVGDHPGRGQGNDSLEVVGFHAAHQHGEQPALGVAAQVQARDEVQGLGVVHHRQGAGDPLIEGVVLELAAALAVAVHLGPEGGEADLLHGLAGGHDVALLHVAGEAVDDDDQRAFFFAFGQVQLGVEVHAVTGDEEFFHRGSFLRRVNRGAVGPGGG